MQFLANYAHKSDHGYVRICFCGGKQGENCRKSVKLNKSEGGFSPGEKLVWLKLTGLKWLSDETIVADYKSVERETMYLSIFKEYW